jgi:hypothetical protein
MKFRMWFLQDINCVVIHHTVIDTVLLSSKSKYIFMNLFGLFEKLYDVSDCFLAHLYYYKEDSHSQMHLMNDMLSFHRMWYVQNYIQYS